MAATALPASSTADVDAEDAALLRQHVALLRGSRRRQHIVPREVLISACENAGCDPSSEVALWTFGIAVDAFARDLVRVMAEFDRERRRPEHRREAALDAAALLRCLEAAVPAPIS